MVSLTGILAGLAALGAVWLVLLLIGYVFWVRMAIDAVRQGDTLWMTLFAFSFFTGYLPGIVALAYYYRVYHRG